MTAVDRWACARPRAALGAAARNEGYGEHRTFATVNTMAKSAPVGGSGRWRSIEKRYVTEPGQLR